MPQPTAYNRQYSFSSWQAQHPSDPLPGDKVDAELNALKATLDEILANLAKIQRDDGAIASASIGADQLKPELSAGVAPAVAWAALTAFKANQSIIHSLILYRATADFTSGAAFDTNNLVVLADLSSISIAPGSIGTTQLADGAVTTAKIADSNVTVAKIGGLTGSRLIGRYSNTTGQAQQIQVGSGMTLNSATGIVSAP